MVNVLATLGENHYPSFFFMQEFHLFLLVISINTCLNQLNLTGVIYLVGGVLISLFIGRILKKVPFLNLLVNSKRPIVRENSEKLKLPA